MVKQKIYVNQNYHEITLGSAEHFARVHSQPDGADGRLFFIIGDDKDKQFCIDHGLARLDLASGEMQVEEEVVVPEGGANVVRDNEEYLKTGKLPVKYFCKDCVDHHAKGEPEYYTCLDKFTSGIWSTDIEPPLPGEAEGLPDPNEGDEDKSLPDPNEGDEGKTQVAPVVDTRTHNLNSPDSIKLVESLTDFTELNMIKDGEGKHPDFTGGRKGVLNAIHERIQSLLQDKK